MKKTKEVQKKAEEKLQVLENKMKNAEAEREKELKNAQQKLDAAKKRANASSKKMKEKEQVSMHRKPCTSDENWSELACLLEQYLNVYCIQMRSFGAEISWKCVVPKLNNLLKPLGFLSVVSVFALEYLHIFPNTVFTVVK